MRMSPRPRNGVTLIEMLVAIALLGILMGAAYRALHTGHEVAQNQQEMMMATSEGWEMLGQISAELRGIPADTVRSHPLLQGEYHTADIGRIEEEFADKGFSFASEREIPAADVQFFTLAGGRSPNDGSGPELVQYGIQYPPNSRQKSGLYRRTAPLKSGLDSADWELESPRVQAMNIEYRTATSDWQKTWTREYPPDVVRVTLWLRATPPGQELRLQRFSTSVGLPSAHREGGKR